MFTKKNISNLIFLFLFFHLIIWTVVPSVSNINLPLDTIEALAWGSNLDWGFNKHPPFSAFAVEFFYIIFGSNDWAYYLLSQIFVLVALIYVWKFSSEIFEDKVFPLLSVFILTGIYFYNFTTPEFNVNVSQLPFWAMTVFFFWRGINYNHKFDWLFFGFFSALGFLSKYLFIYILISLFIFILTDLKKHKPFLINYCLSIMISCLVIFPHLIWLFENNFSTIFYGLSRSALIESSYLNHLKNPMIFLLKQLIILIPFFLLFSTLLKKTSFNINFRKKDKKLFFLFFVNIVPIFLVLLTSILTGAKIRTMWMTPFYLFLGTLFFYTFKDYVNLKKIKRFNTLFLFFLLLSPSIYFITSVIDKNKRTDYPGKEISRLVQERWDNNFINEIRIVIGDEWSAGNLSYHLMSRPKWINNLKNKMDEITDDQGVIYTGNPKILKKICPGVFGTIKPVGYCMIGKR